MDTPYVKSIIPDIKAAPDQVLKFIIHEQSKEMEILREKLETLYNWKQRCKSTSDILRNKFPRGLDDCFQCPSCDAWFENDDFYRCFSCKNDYCSYCFDENVISTIECEKCDEHYYYCLNCEEPMDCPVCTE